MTNEFGREVSSLRQTDSVRDDRVATPYNSRGSSNFMAEDNRYHPMPIRVKGSKQRPSPRSPVASTGGKVPDSNPDRLFLCGSPCFSVALPLHFKLEWTFAFHLHVSCRRHGQDSYKHQHNAHAHHTYSSQQLDSAQSTVPAGAVLVPVAV